MQTYLTHREIQMTKKSKFKKFDHSQTSNKLPSKKVNKHTVQQREITNVFRVIEEALSNAEKSQWLEEKIALLEKELAELKQTTTAGWVSLEKAAIEIGKSPSAIRQILKSSNKMAKGKVWKQECKGASIYVNLKEFCKAI